MYHFINLISLALHFSFFLLIMNEYYSDLKWIKQNNNKLILIKYFIYEVFRQLFYYPLLVCFCHRTTMVVLKIK